MTRSAKTVVRPLTTIFDVASGDMRQIAAHWDRWPGPACWSADGKRLFVTADDAGDTAVFAIDAAAETPSASLPWPAAGRTPI